MDIMNAQYHQSANYIPPGSTKAGRSRKYGQWDGVQHQQRAGRVSMSDFTDSRHFATSTASRKRADSHQPSSTPPQLRRSIVASYSDQSHTSAMSAQQGSSHDYDDQPRRYSSADPGDVGNRLSPQLSPYHYDEPRLSGGFNAPTDLELERTIEHRKSLKGVERLRSKVKGWVRA